MAKVPKHQPKMWKANGILWYQPASEKDPIVAHLPYGSAIRSVLYVRNKNGDLLLSLISKLAHNGRIIPESCFVNFPWSREISLKEYMRDY